LKKSAFKSNEPKFLETPVNSTIKSDTTELSNAAINSTFSWVTRMFINL